MSSDVEGWASGGTASILPTERARASFTTHDMTHKLDGGAAKTARRRWIVSMSAGMELGLEKYHMSRADLLDRHARDFIEIHADFGQRMGEGKFKPTREEVAWMSEHAMNSGPFWDHYVPFLTALEGQGSAAQFAEWGVRAAKLQIIGTYAQTELGHGSNVRGLQTTATFDPSSDEFVLETPTLRAIKWWPGGMAKLATHAIVYAQLRLGTSEHGVHAFVVQLRDDSHTPLPGIELGELGPKMGDAGHDSGCMRLLGVRIPRQNLLDRYQHVTRDGQYVKVTEAAANVPTHYSSMLLTRASWVQLAGGQLAKACTIAVRYSAVRQQGFVAGGERQLLDHTVQRRRLLTQVASAYAVKFTARQLLSETAAIEDPGIPIKDKLQLMPSLAADSGTLKALATLMAADGIEDLRRSCGGNGYLLSSGIAALALDDLWHVTAEGDFVVLLLAAARFLVKRSQVSSFPVDAERCPSAEDWMNSERTLFLVGGMAAQSLEVAAQSVADSRAQGVAEDDALNDAAELLITAASWRGYHTMFVAFHSEASAEENPPEVTMVLQKLCALFGCYVVTRMSAGMRATCTSHVGEAMRLLCAQLRNDAVALVDSFDYEDRVLNSTLGVKDGRVYEALYNASRRGFQDFAEPFSGYTSHLQPMLDREYLSHGAARARVSAERSRL